MKNQLLLIFFVYFCFLFLTPKIIYAADSTCCSKGFDLIKDTVGNPVCFDRKNTTEPATICNADQICDNSSGNPECKQRVAPQQQPPAAVSEMAKQSLKPIDQILSSIFKDNKPVERFQNLGGLLSGLFNIAFYIAGFLLLYWLVWGVFQYIFAGGNKENLAKARARITWAVVGFLILIISFAVKEYAQGIIPQNSKLTPVTIKEQK